MKAASKVETIPNRLFWLEHPWALLDNITLDAITQALSSGVRDAKLFFQSATIHLAARRADGGARFLREAAEINPHYQDVHITDLLRLSCSRPAVGFGLSEAYSNALPLCVFYDQFRVLALAVNVTLRIPDFRCMFVFGFGEGGFATRLAGQKAPYRV